MIRAVTVIALWAAVMTLGACSDARVQPYTYRDNKEMTDKPGLFTGSHSELTILRD